MRVANYKVRHLEEEVKWRELGLRRHLDEEDFTKVEKISKEQAERTFIQVRERQIDKFDRLTRRETAKSEEPRSTNTQRKVDQSKWVINQSKHTLTNKERAVLQRGLNFAPCPKLPPKTEIIAGVEPALRKCQNTASAERARSIIASIITEHRPQQSNISTEERHAIQTLKRNKDITILAADKGNATVILDTETYIEKAHALLNQPPFQQVRKDPTRKNEKQVNDTLKRLANQGKIDRELEHSLRVPTNGTRPPLFYGVVKIHKEGYPLRPIVSAVGSATYTMSKYVSRILTPYVKETPSYIANTMALLKKLENVSIAEDEIIVSFDVKSLYTNVPRKDAFECIREIIGNDTMFKTKTGTDPEAFLDILKISLSTTSFQFREKHYELSDGLPMGSPASPAIANLFMAKLEETALATFNDRPKIWYRYVDDVLSIVKTSALNKLLRHLNNQHMSITFTIECEENSQLPFMDTRIHRIAGSLKTGVYRKPTHTGRYLQFTSNHPQSAKRSVVNALFQRLNYITLGEEEKKKEEKQIYQELSANGYPLTFVKRVSRKNKNSMEHSNTQSDGKQKPVGVATIPYMKGTSEQIARVLSRLQIKTTMKPRKWKWSIMNRAKDSIRAQEDPGVVYAVGCTECEQVYVGETNRTAKQRIKEHRCHTRTGHTELSAIAEHAHSTGHDIHWQPHIVAKEKNTTMRKVKEAIAIHKLGQEKTMNLDCGIELSKLWLSLVES